MALKVGGIATRIPASVLGQEHAVSVISPTGAGASNVIGAKPKRESALASGSTYIVHEPAHKAEANGLPQA